MKHLLLFILCFCLLISANATHIVGGEFELKYVSGSSYRLTLNMYFDRINGDPEVIDPYITVSIFEKNRNTRITNILIFRSTTSPVNYTSVACTNAALITDKITYTTNITLLSSIYNSPNGYYVVWERCCRNRVISNIYESGSAGQTFYLEFPAVIRNNVSFVNSSPELFPPVSDYACRNELFYYDFSGQDPDGDSLVYEMVTPLNGYSMLGAPAPTARPAPYPLVNWTAGLGIMNQIPGNPSVNIHPHTGLLTVRPTQLGLFVFGVRCSEYRNNVKIGEVRRDFQLLVLNCPVNEKPQLLARQAGKTDYYHEGDTILVKATDNRCLDLFLTDEDPNEVLTLEAIPINFTTTENITSLRHALVNQNGTRDTVQTSACFPACLDSEKKLYLVDFILQDDGCSLPKKDTVRVAFQVEPIPNQPPAITTTAATTLLKPSLGDVLEFDVTGTDADNDLVSLSLQGENFDVSKTNISFPGANGTGTATSRFTWKIDCNAFSQAVYKLNFTATTMICNKPVTATTILEVQPQHSNDKPEIATNLAGQTINVLYGTTVTDSIFGTDPNLDLIALSASGDGFALASVGMVFTPATGLGKAKSYFSWTPSCQLSGQQQFRVNFAVTETTCQAYPPQVVSVIFKVQYEPENNFTPANIFTPNNDKLNDYFTMPALPPNYCNSVFAGIKIYNRWGNLVYQSRDRSFKWDGKNVTDGIYYYSLIFSDKQYKGTVTLVR